MDAATAAQLQDTIETAWRRGARFDGWDEAFDYQMWTEAFERTNIDPAFYAHRERSFDEILAWTHIHSGRMTTDWLEKNYDHVFVKLDVPRPTAPAAV